MKLMVKDMVRRAPPPGAFGKPSDDEDEGGEYGGGEDDEDASGAVAMSAYEDFARLAGFKPSEETFAAFREAVRAVK